jgi:TPR repeat protein
MQPAASAGTIAAAQIKQATAQEALRRQKAEADEAVARACNTRMQQLTQNMYLDDFNANGTVKPGSPTARMMELYNKDCDPAAGASGGSSAPDTTDAFDSAVKAYQSIKKIALDSTTPKFTDEQASMQAACMFGAQATSRLQFVDSDTSKKMMGDAFDLCFGVPFFVSILHIKTDAFDLPHDMSKAPDDTTRKLWRNQTVAAEIKQCSDRKMSYEALISCSCVAGARVGANISSSVDGGAAKQSSVSDGESVCKAVSDKLAKSDGTNAETNYQKTIQATARVNELMKIEQANKAGDYATAYSLSQKKAAATEADEVKETGKAGKRSAGALSSLSWHALFAQKFSEALTSAERSITLDPPNLVPQTNRAHALMFLGRTAEAKDLYLANKGKPLQGKTWELVIADDFADLRKAGITHPLMVEIEKEFAASGQGSGTRSLAPSLPATPIRQTEEPTPAPDPDVEAVNRYSYAAARGDAEAQLKLGNMYGAGRGGLDTNPREAARLYKLSADQGNAGAQLQLAYMYENGDVLPKDWREAARLYRLSADQGNAEAQANLADFYERGDAGLRKDLCEAMRLRKLAAAQGNAYAQKNLNEMRVARCKF